jgi:hypothetical protein
VADQSIWSYTERMEAPFDEPPGDKSTVGSSWASKDSVMPSDLSRSATAGRDNAVGIWLLGCGCWYLPWWYQRTSTGSLVRAAQSNTRFERLLGRLGL